MDLNTLANVATAATVLVGLLFGVAQVRQAQRKRRDLAAIEVAHGFLTPELREAFRRILTLPGPAHADDIRSDPRLAGDAEIIVYTGEAFGVMVFEGAIALHTLDRLMGGFLRAAWARMGPYVALERQVRGIHYAEWFQWLAERLEEHPVPGKETGAHLAHRGWVP